MEIAANANESVDKNTIMKITGKLEEQTLG